MSYWVSNGRKHSICDKWRLLWLKFSADCCDISCNSGCSWKWDWAQIGISHGLLSTLITASAAHVWVLSSFCTLSHFVSWSVGVCVTRLFAVHHKGPWSLLDFSLKGSFSLKLSSVSVWNLHPVWSSLFVLKETFKLTEGNSQKAKASQAKA